MTAGGGYVLVVSEPALPCMQIGYIHDAYSCTISED